MQRFPIRRPLALLIFVIIGLAMMGTSPCEPTPQSVQIVGVDHSLVVQAVGDPTYYDEPLIYYYVSQDDGMTWDILRPITPNLLSRFDLDIVIPTPICTADGLVCYRVSGREQLQQSLDRGESWELVWEIPAARRDYMNRRWRGFQSWCKSEPDFEIFDIVLLEQGDTHSVVGAMGNEGVLIWSPGQVTERVAVDMMKPTPIKVPLVLAPFRTFREIGQAMCVFIVVWNLVPLVLIPMARRARSRTLAWKLAIFFPLSWPPLRWYLAWQFPERLASLKPGATLAHFLAYRVPSYFPQFAARGPILVGIDRLILASLFLVIPLGAMIAFSLVRPTFRMGLASYGVLIAAVFLSAVLCWAALIPNLIGAVDNLTTLPFLLLAGLVIIYIVLALVLLILKQLRAHALWVGPWRGFPVLAALWVMGIRTHS